MNHVERFLEIVSKWNAAYVCAVQSYVGLKSPQGERFLLYGRTVFEWSQSGVDQSHFSFETDHIFAGRFVRALKSGDVSALIEKAKIGHMMDDFAALCPKESPEKFSPYLTSNFHPLVSNLSISGETNHTVEIKAAFPQHVGWEMKSADVPFDSLDELVVHCGLPAWDKMRSETRLELVATAPGRINGRSIITDGVGIIECRVAKPLDIFKLKVGVRVFGKNHEIIRKSVKGNEFEWCEEGDSKVGKCKVSVGDAPVLEAYLSYDGIPIDQSSISDPNKHLNPRHAIHQLFDPKNVRLPQMLLDPEKDKSQVFEGAVSTLLTLLGFSTSNYGRFPKLQEGPDIIAITPGGHVAVVECTVGLLNQNDKIAKLVQRTHAIGEKLANAGHSDKKIQSVIVTLLTRDEVAANIKDAQAHGIAVICRENLEDALKQIELPLDADRFFEGLKKLIPPPNKEASIFGEFSPSPYR